MANVHIEYFTDVLCVWAYVEQVRIDQLVQNFGEDVTVEHRFIDVFGDCSRLTDRWADRGGLAGYGDHVREVVGRFDHCDVNPEVWVRNMPNSSIGCHVFLRAVDLLDVPEALPKAAWAMRKAFFTECADIGTREVQFGIAESIGLDRAAIQSHLASGEAHACLSRDSRAARTGSVQMSPTLLFNEGRQRLAGNVGYRVIEANIRELLSNPSSEPSWC